MTKLRLKKNEDRRIRAGHPWVFSNEIERIDGEREAGITAELFDAAGGFLGCGYYTPHSLIAFRLLSRQQEDVDCVPFA
jgi:23S rRNA (cytosine1962-C5)-methyltransferase